MVWSSTISAEPFPAHTLHGHPSLQAMLLQGGGIEGYKQEARAERRRKPHAYSTWYLTLSATLLEAALQAHLISQPDPVKANCHNGLVTYATGSVGAAKIRDK